jgi:hypothetical protein
MDAHPRPVPSPAGSTATRTEPASRLALARHRVKSYTPCSYAQPPIRHRWPVRRVRTHRRQVVAIIAAAIAYSWWASGLHPFTATCYVAVGLPTAVVIWLVIARPTDRTQPVTLRRALPWLVLVATGVVLEIAGLALGGRSANVPTLSTVIDHALPSHGVRFVLYLAWLATAASMVRTGPTASCR